MSTHEVHLLGPTYHVRGDKSGRPRRELRQLGALCAVEHRAERKVYVIAVARPVEYVRDYPDYFEYLKDWTIDARPTYATHPLEAHRAHDLRTAMRHLKVARSFLPKRAAAWVVELTYTEITTLKAVQEVDL